ncbi:MAG: hypothetical protein NC828_01950 [Candidatus Omnitrophica bacterium]|nr:hypothetical protein [Candidatus Omnitrophota bacterium]
MRKALLAKRRRFSGILFFAALSWMGVGMGLDIKNGLIAKDFGTFLEGRLNNIFVGKEIMLSQIAGNVFRSVTIDEFSISKRLSEGGGVLSPIFSVDRIIIKYNLLDLLRRQFEKISGIYLISPSLFFVPTQAIGLSPSGYPFVTNSVYSPNGIKFHILNGDIGTVGKKPILTNLTGVVVLRDSTLVFNNMKGNFLTLPVLVNGRIQRPFEAPLIKLSLLTKDKYYTARIAFKSMDQKGGGTVFGNARLFDKISVFLKGKVTIVSDELIEINDIAVGIFPLSTKPMFTISGDINLTTKSSKFIIRAKSGFIEVMSNISQKKGLSIYARVNHLRAFGFDVLSQIDINTSLHEKGEPYEILRGSFRTQNLIINYKPFPEIKARWVLKKNELFISGLSLGDGYRLAGILKSTPPYDVDLNLKVTNALLEDWLAFSKDPQSRFISGVINGEMKIKGPIKSPTTKGRFEIRNGNIQDVSFNSLNFNLSGKGTLLVVSDSKIFKEGGFLLMEGEIDLAKLGKRNIFEDLKIETDQRVIVWEGWDISKDISASEVKLKKDISEEFKVNFKTYVNDKDGPAEERKSEIGVDYKIKKDASINMRMRDDGAFVGVEHKLKF